MTCPYDVNIVFGYPIEKVVRERAKAAFEKGAYQYLVTGGKTPSLDPDFESEAEMGYESLKALGVSDSDIICEDQAQNTIDNIILSEEKLDSAQDVGLSSSPRHLRRIERGMRFCESKKLITPRNRHRIETAEVQNIPYTIMADTYTELQLLGIRMNLYDTGKTNILKHIINKTLK